MSGTQSYRQGAIYAILAGVFLSTAGLLVRFLHDTDAFTVLVYRSLTFFLVVLAFITIRDGRNPVGVYRRLRTLDWVVAACLATGFVFYLLSLVSTSVANTVLTLSTGPCFAAVLGALVLKEPVGKGTWLAILLAIAGVSVMVSGGLETSDLLGIAYALIAVMSFAAMLIALRLAGNRRDMMPATSLAGLVAAVVAAVLAPTLKISAHDLLLAILLGSLQIGTGFILYTLAARSVPAAQIPLYGLTEVALAPVWVLLVFAEQPAKATIWGGLLVIIAVVLQGYLGVRREAGATANT